MGWLQRQRLRMEWGQPVAWPRPALLVPSVRVQVPVLQPPAKVSGRGLEPVQEPGLTQEPPARARPPEQRRPQRSAQTDQQ